MEKYFLCFKSNYGYYAYDSNGVCRVFGMDGELFATDFITNFELMEFGWEPLIDEIQSNDVEFYTLATFDELPSNTQNYLKSVIEKGICVEIPYKVNLSESWFFMTLYEKGQKCVVAECDHIGQVKYSKALNEIKRLNERLGEYWYTDSSDFLDDGNDITPLSNGYVWIIKS